MGGDGSANNTGGAYNRVDGSQDVFMLALTQIILHPN